MTNDEIRELGLSIEGLKLKEQPDGSKDFHPYIYELVRAALARACQPQWISVDDRKPAAKDYCLTLGSNDEVEFAVYSQDKDGFYFASIDAPICDKFGYDSNGILYGELINVRHWMPLPERPNKGD